MSLRVTTHTFPWDLGRLGVERTLGQMTEEGIDGIDLASTYHPIDALSPRGGVRLFSSARGAVFFPARADRYGRIRPLTHSAEMCGVWPEVFKHAGALGLAVNAWTVTLFQPWIRDAYPDCARVLPSGDPSGSGVCPAHDDVREYLATLCADMVDQFDLDVVRLEGVISHMFDLDWLRPRVLVDIPPLARTLLNLCFCSTCTQRAIAAGIDVVRLRRIVNDTIAAEIEDGIANPGRSETVAADPELHAFVVQYVQGSIELVQAATSRIKDKARISISAATPYAALIGASAEEQLLTQMIGEADQVSIHAGGDGNRRVAGLASTATPRRDLSMLFASVRVSGAVASAPRIAAPPDKLAYELQEVAALGASEVTLYNYGLLPEREVAQFVTAVRQAFPLSAP
jgi:hypothetical protein